jgi:hypothetical protein
VRTLINANNPGKKITEKKKTKTTDTIEREKKTGEKFEKKLTLP